MKVSTKPFWIFIIFVAILVRFYDFTQSVYFGFDEARDAFVSQAIYQQRDFKLIGPPANGVSGLNHGVLHWYVVGIFYLLGMGSPFWVAFIYRLLNGLAILPIYWIAKKLFGERTALIASLFFAFSFEAGQYAMYYGNPSLAIWSWICLFAGAVMILKMKNKFWGLPLMALGIATGAQFELFLVTLLPIGIVILSIVKKELKKIDYRSWILAMVTGLAIISPYILGEFKNGFRSFTIIRKLTESGYNFSTESKWLVYVQRWLLMLYDNFLPIQNKFLWPIAMILIGFWVYQAKQKIEYRLILAWILGGIVVFIFGSYNAYYINVGVGTGLIIGLAIFIDYLWDINKALAIGLIILALTGNVSRVISRNKDGLGEDIKTQQFMLLADEIKIINQMYLWADKKTFTVRVTSMPYRIQTVWAYLFERYGKAVYGYLPYYETGNALGFPGYLPEPKKGTTCVRFLLREPYGGIPMSLITKDRQEEDYFSEIRETIEIGHFYLERRVSKARDCLDDNFPN